MMNTQRKYRFRLHRTIKEQAAEIERLTELNKEAEEQLCAIAKEFCGDARNCEQHPKTLAGFVVQEVGKVRAEIERLREENQLLKLERDELVRHEERMHADIGAILGSDTSLVDAAARAVTEIKRLRDQHDTYAEMVEQLTWQLDAAAVLLRRPGRVEWGYDAEENALAYFLDGKFAGPTIRHAIRMAAKDG